MSIWNLGETLRYFAFYIFWQIFVNAPLSILRMVEKFFNISEILFVQKVVFNNDDGKLNVSSIYIFISLISVLFLVTMFIFLFIKNMVLSSEKNQFFKIRNSLKNITSIFLIILLIPISFFIANLVINIALNNISQTKSLNSLSLTDSLLIGLKPEAMDYVEWLKYIKENGSNPPSFDVWRDMNWSIGTAIVLFVVALISIVMILKLMVYVISLQFKVGLLILSSPIIVIWKIEDSNSKLKYLIENIISNSLKIFTVILFFKLGGIIVSTSTNYVTDVYKNPTLNIIITSLFLISYLTGISKFSESIGNNIKFANLFHPSKWSLRNNFQSNLRYLKNDSDEVSKSINYKTIRKVSY
ncbi:hypothetical protein EI74_0610 [Mycoplasma testudineum]|uniref:Uncharacterized protein n=1 Tax=Mycoplasma testudineum TaxID=244584 RepID=A0A4R6IFV5_9MOLU|nr:hypothetical protein [Mycoplasma testudineum]OYD26677.1 hypothetical protein CG473_02655 [Mycoplasma testudineum]TDO19805.1 hypothetical protein EI74_0610 [Mycoplasma testudineum]